MTDKPFLYCLNTSTIRCGGISLEQAITTTAGAGYDAIEPWVSEIDAFTARGGSLADLDRRISDAGLKVMNLIGFFSWASPDAQEREKGFAEARRCLELASHLHCSYVAAPPLGIHTTPGVDLLDVAGRYGELLEMGRNFGVTPILEFWGGAKSLGKLGEALLVAAECGKAGAVILADVFHMYKGSGHFNGLNLIGPRTIGLLHMNDYPADPPRATITDGDRVHCGDGTAPLTWILQRLYDAGYRGALSLELFNQTYWQQDAAIVAKIGLEKM
jgi:2-keto-myo-inositol isomerase